MAQARFLSLTGLEALFPKWYCFLKLKCTHSWPLDNMGLNYVGPLIHPFPLSKYIVGPVNPWVSHPWIQPIKGQKQYFQSTVGKSADVEGWLYALFYAISYKWRASMNFGPWGVLELTPMDTKGQLSFLGVKSYMYFWMHESGCP